MGLSALKISEEEQGVDLLLFIVLIIKNLKPSGLPDSNVIFFVATKKTKQKKTWRLAVRKPPVLPLAFQKTKEQQRVNLLLSVYGKNTNNNPFL